MTYCLSALLSLKFIMQEERYVSGISDCHFNFMMNIWILWWNVLKPEIYSHFRIIIWPFFDFPPHTVLSHWSIYMPLNEKWTWVKRTIPADFYSPIHWTPTEIGLSLMGSVKSAGRVTATTLSVPQRQQLKALKFCQWFPIKELSCHLK